MQSPKKKQCELCGTWFSGALSRHLNTAHPEDAPFYKDTASTTFASQKRAKVNVWVEKFRAAALMLPEDSFDYQYLNGQIAEPASALDEELDGVEVPHKFTEFWNRTFSKTPAQWAQEHAQQATELQKLLQYTTDDMETEDESAESEDVVDSEEDLSESEEDFSIARKLVDFESVELDNEPVLSDEQFAAFQNSYHEKIKAAREKK